MRTCKPHHPPSEWVVQHALRNTWQEFLMGSPLAATLSFYEYLQIKQIATPGLPTPGSLAQLFEWPAQRFAAVAADARPLVGDFHEYLLRGGFPQSALMASIPQAQKLLREDIVDKVLNHVFTRYYRQSIGFSYWKGRKDQEVDIIASVAGRLVPFEVKYRSQATGAGDLKGLEQFCADRKVDRGYVISKDITDFGVMPLLGAAAGARVAKIPAPLACYWLGLLEVASADKH